MKTDIKHLLKVVSLPLAFAHTPLYRLFVLGGRKTIAHAKTCLGLLVCVADSHLQLLSAIRYTDSYRNYSINKMDFTSMSAYGSLAGHRNFFCIGPPICNFACSGGLFFR